MRNLRWLLFVPGAIVSWYLTFFIGLIIYGVVEEALCPPEDMVSGACANADVLRKMDFIVFVFAGLSAVVVVTVATLIAPGRRKLVAWAAYAAGAVAACLFGVAAEAPLEALVALGSGLAATLVITRVIPDRKEESAAAPSTT